MEIEKQYFHDDTGGYELELVTDYSLTKGFFFRIGKVWNEEGNLTELSEEQEKEFWRRKDG